MANSVGYMYNSYTVQAGFSFLPHQPHSHIWESPFMSNLIHIFMLQFLLVTEKKILC
jgi:hypothetical protein